MLNDGKILRLTAEQRIRKLEQSEINSKIKVEARTPHAMQPWHRYAEAECKHCECDESKQKRIEFS